MAPETYTRFVLRERPATYIVPSTFRKEVLPFDLKPKDAQVLVKVNWLSLDPAMRGWIRDTRSYIPPVQIGEVMRATGLGTVIQTGKESIFKTGDVVQGVFGKRNLLYQSKSRRLTRLAPGWTEYALMPDNHCEKIVYVSIATQTGRIANSIHPRPPNGISPLHFLHTLGMPGMTAYFVSEFAYFFCQPI